MKHTLGNTPKCKDCYYWIDKEAGDNCREDGWCTNKKQCSIGVNGRKREHPPEREPVRWNGGCKWWEDAETRITHFEALTRKPEEWRTPQEKEYLCELLSKNLAGLPTNRTSRTT